MTSVSAFHLEDELFHYFIGDFQPHDIHPAKDLSVLVPWNLEEDTEGDEVDRSPVHWKYIAVPRSIGEEDETVREISEPVIIVESYETAVRVFHKGRELQSREIPGENRLVYQFYLLEEYQPGEKIYFRIETNPFAGEEIYLSDNTWAGFDRNRFFLFYFYKEYGIAIFSVFAFIIGLAMLIFFIIRWNKRESYLFWFSLFAFTYSIFSLLESNVINIMLPLPPQVDFYIPLLAQDLMPILLLLFYLSFMGDSWKKLFHFAAVGQGILLFLRLFVMISGRFFEWSDQLSLFYPILLYMVLAFHLFFKQRKNSFAVFFILAFIALGMTYLFQLISEFTTLFGDLPLFLGPRIFFLILGMIPFYSYLRNEAHIREQNKAFARYVPQEFLRYLRKEEITQVSLGDQVECEMTILFTDIRSFTTISENMTPERNFRFLNRYLGIMGPIVRNNHGFIDKYIGDAVMALFPHDPFNAVQTAREMLEALEDLNRQAGSAGFPEVRIGLGIHTGRAMLGIVGEEERYQGTVISDAVNLASRLESLTKKTGYPILLSSETGRRINQKVPVEYLGSIRVKGKKRSTKVYTLKDLKRSPSGRL